MSCSNSINVAMMKHFISHTVQFKVSVAGTKTGHNKGHLQKKATNTNLSSLELSSNKHKGKETPQFIEVKEAHLNVSK